VLVQGDTATVAASLVAFYARVKVWHAEAGLRTYDKWQPFPEEINRRVVGVVADYTWGEQLGVSPFIHSTAEVSPRAVISEGTKIWHQAQVREGARLGANCIVGKGVYIDFGVIIGNNVKIQNGASIYHGVTLEDGVFCGPYCVFTNDRQPRAIDPNGTLKSADDWTVSETRVRTGASIGAHAAIVCGVTIGQWAMIGAGAVVTRDVPDYGLVYGNPARLHGFVCPCGEKLVAATNRQGIESGSIPMVCPKCRTEILIPQADYARLVR
jgi:UDP-2-acetamido-3-amino-2,3-dideoxy-glucuronate N-acetyltransferase